jgi:hypothetical protein
MAECPPQAGESERHRTHVRGHPIPGRTGHSYCSGQSKVHHKKNRPRGVQRAGESKPAILRTLFARFESWEEPVPEAAYRRFLLVAPGEMAILAIELLGNNLERAQHTDQRRSHEFPGHLWILDV